MTSVTTVATATVRADEELPDVPGFFLSRFAPALREAARRCLSHLTLEELSALRGSRTAIVLGSAFGDTATMEVVGRELAERSVVQPLLFHQAVPTPILSLIARDYGITGAISCVSTMEDTSADAHAVAQIILAEDDADAVLVIVADLEPTERTRTRAGELTGVAVTPPDGTTTATLIAKRRPC